MAQGPVDTRLAPVTLAAADWLRQPQTQAVFLALAKAGHPARAVGGVVRNALLGLPVTDIDIATPATPDAVIEACSAAGLATIPTGLAHGTVTVIAGGTPYEVTTLRRDVATDGRHATVDFTDDWALDASRRDFTMNALYCDRNGQVFDPLGGYPDALARKVRFIGDPDQRIAEDYLRILRFFRFHAVLGDGELDRAGRDACVRGRDGLQQLSAERVRDELLKLLMGSRVGDAVREMTDCGLLTLILRRAPRPRMLAGMLAAERALGGEADAINRLSALAVAVDEDIPALAERFKVSKAQRQAMPVVDQTLMQRMAGLDPKVARRHLYAVGPDAWRRSVLAFRAAAGEVGQSQAQWLFELPARWPIPDLPVKGRDILALGVAPGPSIGAILADVERWWIEQDFADEASVRDQLAAMVALRKG